MRATRMRQGSDQKVTELMILAQQARNAGDMGNAELFWMHARELRPSLPRPQWLDKKPEPVVFKAPPSESELLERVASLPYAQAKLLLEERLQQNPGDLKARQLFLELAERNGDHTEVARHKSLLTLKNSGSWSAYLWNATGLLIFGLLFWQLYALYRDLYH
ncbi:MAG TPA: hypothetical protein PLM07_06430 [Candidatus Rifleibacterium sp.]|nr:hypothetical protein [Candidatus Rifleibacterium sp.]HPT45517.1 hypothetical protein [Candidatus Rifleibacterium sp.]